MLMLSIILEKKTYIMHRHLSPRTRLPVHDNYSNIYLIFTLFIDISLIDINRWRSCSGNTIRCRNSMAHMALSADARPQCAIGHGIWLVSVFSLGVGWSTVLTHWLWWRHEMEPISALLALCAANSPVTGEFPSQRPVTRSFDVFFYQCHIWRHCYVSA